MEEVAETSPRQRRTHVSADSPGEDTFSDSSTEDRASSNACDIDSLADDMSMRGPHLKASEGANFVVATHLTDITKEANVLLDQLQQRFAAEYKSLLHSAVSGASRVKGSFDGSVADRVDFTFTNNRPQEKVTRKRFTARESVLTELLKTNHIKTVYNIFAAILIIFSVQTLVYDLIEEGRVRIDFGLISWGFGKFPLVISIWMCMMTSTIALYPAFDLWTSLRVNNPRVVDKVFLLLYVIYLVAFLVLPPYTLAEYDLPPISTLVVTIEQVRLVMKTHSFIRENIPHVLSTRKSSENGLNFSRYLYFLFAPTLIYRDEYPRTNHIHWDSVVFDVAQLIICIFYTYYIFMRFCIPNFQNFNSDQLTIKAFVFSVFGCMMPGTLVLLIGFFAVLHCWLNAWAEMLTFADRLFYKDWWNSTGFSGYYRNWNIVVHDWLFSYIYQDVYMLLGFRRHLRWLAMYSTFFISAIFHEYIIIAALRIFYPVLFVMFGIVGVGFIYVTNGHHERTSNIFMWVMLFAGNGILMCLYSIEYFSRRNCPPAVQNPLIDRLIPRSWFCEADSTSILATNPSQP